MLWHYGIIVPAHTITSQHHARDVTMSITLLISLLSRTRWKWSTPLNSMSLNGWLCWSAHCWQRWRLSKFTVPSPWPYVIVGWESGNSPGPYTYFSSVFTFIEYRQNVGTRGGADVQIDDKLVDLKIDDISGKPASAYSSSASNRV